MHLAAGGANNLGFFHLLFLLFIVGSHPLQEGRERKTTVFTKIVEVVGVYGVVAHEVVHSNIDAESR